MRRPGGGRPRLYCSDTHRAEARRRRLGSRELPTDATRYSAASAAPGGATATDLDAGLEIVRRLLHDAVASLEQLQTAVPRDDALVATIRAEATAEILSAQQAAADAARQAAANQERLVRERGEWKATLGELHRDNAERLRALEELSGALDGARTELEDELLRHHSDAENAEATLQAQRAAHAAHVEQATAELEELRQRLAAALGAAEHDQRRARRAEESLAVQGTATVELEVRVARAEEQSRHAATRLLETREELAKLRSELAEERRHHRSVEAELRHRTGPPPAAGSTRTRRMRPSSTA